MLQAFMVFISKVDFISIWYSVVEQHLYVLEIKTNKHLQLSTLILTVIKNVFAEYNTVTRLYRMHTDQTRGSYHQCAAM